MNVVSARPAGHQGTFGTVTKFIWKSLRIEIPKYIGCYLVDSPAESEDDSSSEAPSSTLDLRRIKS